VGVCGGVWVCVCVCVYAMEVVCSGNWTSDTYDLVPTRRSSHVNVGLSALPLLTRDAIAVQRGTKHLQSQNPFGNCTRLCAHDTNARVYHLCCNNIYFQASHERCSTCNATPTLFWHSHSMYSMFKQVAQESIAYHLTFSYDQPMSYRSSTRATVNSVTASTELQFESNSFTEQWNFT